MIRRLVAMLAGAMLVATFALIKVASAQALGRHMRFVDFSVSKSGQLEFVDAVYTNSIMECAVGIDYTYLKIKHPIDSVEHNLATEPKMFERSNREFAIQAVRHAEKNRSALQKTGVSNEQILRLDLALDLDGNAELARALRNTCNQ